jgi:hypothetical protein
VDRRAEPGGERRAAPSRVPDFREFSAPHVLPLFRRAQGKRDLVSLEGQGGPLYIRNTPRIG